MTNPATTTPMAMTPKLRKRLEEHVAERDRLRAEIGDVNEALSALVREMFDAEAVAELTMHRDRGNGNALEDEDDFLDGW